MTTYIVSSGFPFSGVTLSGGDVANVISGGTATDAAVRSGASVTVFSSGVASFTVLSGGFETVSSGGTATGTVVSSGGEIVANGGTASFSVLSGGTEVVNSGGTAIATEVRAGAELAVLGGGIASVTVVSGGGTIAVHSGGTVDFTAVSRGATIDFPDLVFSGGGTAAVSSAGLLTVTEGTSSATLQLTGTYSRQTFLPGKETGTGSGTAVTLTQPPRTLAWTGVQDSDFANAANWDDLTNSLLPAVTPPNETDTAELLAGGGAITGTGSVAALAFGGIASWEVISAAHLIASSGVTVGVGGTGALLIGGGASVTGAGASDQISGASGEVASMTVDGQGSSWKSAGELIAGDLGSAIVTIGNAGGLTAAAAGSLPAMALGAAAGGDGALLVSGQGSTAILIGQLNVGEAGAGTLTVSGQGTVATGDDAAVDPSEGIDIAAASGGSGEATVTGALSLLSNTGRFVIGDAGLGRLFISAGATVITAPDAGSNLPGAVIANTAAGAGSSADVAGAGSNWQVTGLLDVGAAATGVLDISDGATVTAGSLDAGVTGAAVGQIDLSGAGTNLFITNNATIADDGTGVLSVLNGATFSAASLTIGDTGNSSGAVVVSGTGSTINLTGALNVGTSLGTGDLTVGPGAAVHAGVINLQGQVVQEGGLLDPVVFLDESSDGGTGTAGGDFTIDEGTLFADSKKANGVEVITGTVLGGGTLTISGGTTLDGTTTNSPGLLQLNNIGTLEVTGPVLNAAVTTFMDNGALVGAVTVTGTYEVRNSVIDVQFLKANEVLVLDDIAGFAGTVTSTFGGDRFVITGGTLANLAVSNGTTLTMSDSGQVGGTDRIMFSGPVSAAGFNIVNGNTLQVVACFARGTRIETAAGLVAVESLRVGDLVATADGSREPIVWIGQRAVNCARHPRPETVWPVRVSAHAFGAGRPARDVYLSPDHAVFVNEVLVPVKLLVNGTSIVQVERSSVSYFHVELPRHEVILAEGLAVESHLNTGDRANFQLGAAALRLFPDFAARLMPDAAMIWETRGAAPLVMTGARLEEARRAIIKNAPRRRSWFVRPTSQAG